MRERFFTAVNRTIDTIEWTVLRSKQDDAEVVHQDSMVLTMQKEDSAAVLPHKLIDNRKGNVIIPIPSSELLLRVMELPATDDDELANMTELQFDKISPFPVDQLTISFEALSRGDTTSIVLLAGARRSYIDQIGDEFNKLNISIQSMDVRVLGWLELLKNAEKIPDTGCVVLIIDDGLDFSLIILSEGIPLSIRSLERQEGGFLSEELVYEIEYSLTTVEAEFDTEPAVRIHYWSSEEIPEEQCNAIAERCGIPVEMGYLTDLPPLSEGIAYRAHGLKSQRIELIPREWINREKRKRQRRQFITAISVLAALWLIIMLSFTAMYQYRKFQLNKVRMRSAVIEQPAKIALENRQKLKQLEAYSDRSKSALECLREVTRLLPPGDIKFASFNYKKEKGVTLRGSAANDDIVYDFFDALSTSKLFERLKDQSVNTKTSRNIRRTVFSVTLVLPAGETGK